MKREKSCGALVYRYEDDALMLLLLRHRHGGHWSFPKGHVEALVRQEEEISVLRWAPIEEALRAVTFKNDRTLITMAMEYLGASPKGA